ncbi:N-acetylglucosamine kinase, partial [Mesorhizobium sp. M1A.T.Ca.IN.004.03.1.1]
MTELAIGIDGGGTSCRAAVADRNGNVIGRGKSGPA